MFMCQKQNEAVQLIWIVSHGQFIGSQFKLLRSASSLEQMRLLGHVNTKQRCEIQSVWNAWIQRRTQAEPPVCHETVKRLFNLHIVII